MITDKQIEVRQDLIELKSRIYKSIDSYCAEKNYNLEYAVINTALTQILRDNLQYELKELYKNSSKKKG